MHDLVIRNALIVDGLGSALRPGSLAVAAGRIAAIGEDVGSGREIVDARGLALAPGIIDNHTHYDAQVTWDPDLAASTAAGVTTAIIGNCGFTIAPCRPADRDLTMRNLTNVEGMSLEALRAGIRWEFETVPEYLAMLERNGAGLNLAAFVGHSSVRTFVLREDAARRAATAAEIEAMRTLVAEGMHAGAIGFATSTSPAHNGDGGIPMPSRLADDAELLALTGALGGRGVFMLTKGGQTKVSFLEEVGRAEWPAGGRRGAASQQYRARLGIPRSRRDRRGQRAWAADVRRDLLLSAHDGLHAGGAVSVRGAQLVAAGARAEGRDVQARNRRPGLSRCDPRGARRARGVPPVQRRVGQGARGGKRAAGGHRALENRSLADIGRDQGKHPLDALLDLALEEDLATVFAALLLNSDEDAVARLIRHPHSLVSLSDAGAHLTFFNDAGFGLHLLGHWVRERGVLPLEAAVRKLTSDPASVFGIPDRGRLEQGCAADLLLFDPATVGRGPKRRVFDLPAGASRLVTPAIGVHGVWVNGARVVDESGPIPAAPRAGRLLREFAV